MEIAQFYRLIWMVNRSGTGEEILNANSAEIPHQRGIPAQGQRERGMTDRRCP
jgi:hypothetical protein